MRNSDWPGPFVARADAPTRRRAVWMQCPGCALLFAKPTAHIQQGTDKRMKRNFCSRPCEISVRPKGYTKAPIKVRHCLVCDKEFFPPKNSSPIQHCSHKCGTFTQSRKAAAWQSRAMTTYLASRGLSRTTLSCEYCGSQEKLSLSRKNGDWRDFRPGNLIVHCSKCRYHKRAGHDVRVQEAPRW